MRRILTAAVIGALLMVIGAATPAHAAGCYGASCYGLDPNSAGCVPGSYTPPGASVSTPAGLVELRYSPACGSNWARITNSFGGTWFYVQNINGSAQTYTVPPGFNQAYSNMVNGTVLARAGNSYNFTGWY